MEDLKKRRAAARSAITRIHTYCNNPDSDEQEIIARATKIDQYFAAFESVQDEIEADPMTAENSAREEAVRCAVEEKYYQVKAIQNRLIPVSRNDRTSPDSNNQDTHQFNTVMDTLVRNQSTLGMLVERLGTNQTSTPTPQSETAQHSVQLPRIKLPEFDGTITNWLHFRDLFAALIHNRNNLSNIEKFEYLQGHIRGEALSLIKHLGPSNDNYTIAWELIKSKFDNNVELKRNYFKLLFDQPAMKGAFVSEIKRLLNNTNEGINALKAMNEPVNHWDSFLVFHLERKLDQESQALWCRSVTAAPSMKHFLEFLENRLRELEVCQASKSNIQHKPRGQNNVHTVSIQTCPACSQNHLLFNCEKFKSLSVSDRVNIVKNSNICYNCLRQGHLVNECKGSNCRQCKGRHNTLLHRGTQHIKTNSNSTSVETNKVDINTAYSTASKQITLLPTAVVMILGGDNTYYPCRVLLDSGAQTSLISESCVQRLNLKRTADKTLVCGIGIENKNYTRGKVQIHIKSSTTNKIIATTALVLLKLTQLQPAYKVSNHDLKYFENLCLADPQCNIPSSIDILLGADVFSQCVLNQKIMHPSGSLSAWLTTFGWIILGSTTVSRDQHITIAHTSIDLSVQLQHFWELEEVQENKHELTKDELAAENHYQQTVQRDKSGRYIVRLPFKSPTIKFGDTSIQATKRFYNIEKKFSYNQQLHEGYKQFMHEYQDLDHMELTTDTNAKFYLPHHAVLKPTSSTTKIRVVFDGSAKGPDGTSLNEQLLVGPTIQNDIFVILLQFRKYKVGLCGDIEKMYRQILMHPEDRGYQCILWRDDKQQRLSTYQLKTVTYGTSAAPFLAVRTLKQIAIDNQEANPKLSNIIMQCFYVDDLMLSIAEETEAIQTREQLCATLAKSGLHLRKWSSNSDALLQTIQVDDRELSPDTVIDDIQSVKTLGLYWNTTTDVFKYSVVLPQCHVNVTKREVLSIISKVFDPLGWATPITITLKIFMQKIWIRGSDWDAILPNDLQQLWKNIFENLRAIVDIQIPRWLQYSNEAQIELHAFADASEYAYAAVLYLKVVKENGPITRLITSKTRVAPLKQISVPRLELCACHLASKLINKTKNALNLPNLEIHGWTDSTIVLAWLSDHPRKWKSFVANRTSEIIQSLPAQAWHHIPSSENPADLASRGTTTEFLKGSALWWNGPTILQKSDYSKHIPSIPQETELEKRAKTILHFNAEQKPDLFDYFSDFMHLLRVTTRICRFTGNCQKPINLRQSGFLTVAELKHAHNVLVKKAQQLTFSNEIKTLLKNKQLPSTHKLAALTPFLDDDGIMRVGGRLTNANIGFDQKHPVLLHKNCVFTTLLVRYYHLKYLHAGPRQLQYILGLKYWICSAIYKIKQCVYKCPTCMRHRNKPFTQQMGDLPKYRFDTTSAFHNTGIDYAGPLSIRSWKGRGSRQYKCWISLFVCLSTKAIHLELVTELTTEAFIAALRRFVSRRGKPANIYSDNGTNFIGSNQRLKELLQFMLKEKTQEFIAKKTAELDIQWHFSPPSGPHFGGIWEAGVKSVKYHLHRVLGNAVVTYEEMTTVLCQIEGCLNSRPLTAKFENDPDPLTPSHFLILKAMQPVADQDVTQVASNRLTRWQYLQKLLQTFWKKWAIDYLNQLQQRPKWKLKCENLEKDNIVLVKDEQCPPSKWPIGRILEVHPGQDGLVRVVTVKTQKGIYKRPISKICPLIVDC